MCRTRIAHDDGVDGGAAQTTRDYVRPSRSIFSTHYLGVTGVASEVNNATMDVSPWGCAQGNFLSVSAD
jgi:hypothetical protein